MSNGYARYNGLTGGAGGGGGGITDINGQTGPGVDILAGPGIIVNTTTNTITVSATSDVLGAAIDVYVDCNNGSDTTGTGTNDNPYQTIMFAQSTITDATADKTYTLHLSSGFFAEDPAWSPQQFMNLAGAGQILTYIAHNDDSDIVMTYDGVSFQQVFQDLTIYDNLVITRNAVGVVPITSQIQVDFRFENVQFPAQTTITGSGNTGTGPFNFDGFTLTNCFFFGGTEIDGNAINLDIVASACAFVVLTGDGVDATTTAGLQQEWTNSFFQNIDVTGSMEVIARNSKTNRVVLHGVDAIFNGDATSFPGGSGGVLLNAGATADQFTRVTISNRSRNAERTVDTSPVTLNIFADYKVYTNLTVPGPVTINLPAMISGSNSSEGNEIEVVDAKGDANTNNITVNCGGSDTFAGGGTAATISDAFGSRKWSYSNGVWYVVSSSASSVFSTPNTFAGFSNTGDLVSLPNFQVDTTSGGMNEALTEQPNNNGGFTANNFSVAFEPLQNSPNENWNIQNIQAFMDSNNSGFSQGTNGAAAQLLNLGFTHHGTGDVGGLNAITINSDIGNGTDPITVKGMGMSFGFGNIHANVTMDGSLQGYTFQPNVDAAAIGTSNFSISAFEDFANIGIPVNGYAELSSGPNINSITNNHGYNGVNINPTITTLTGNASYVGYGAAANITNINSGGVKGFDMSTSITNLGSGNITGLRIGPQVSSGGTGSFNGMQIQPSGGATLNTVEGLNITLSGISTNEPQGAVGINSDSRVQVNATTVLRAAQTFQIGSRIENEFTVAPGSPVTGTDSLGINLAGDLAAQDNIANGPFGIGFNSVGFIADMGVAVGKTVDTITVFLPAAALPDPGFTTGGTVTDFHMIRTFPPLSQGGTLNITNLYAFKLDSTFGDFASAATNAWGIYLDSTGIKNKIGGGIEVQTNTISSAYTVDSGSIKDNVIFVDTSGGAFTLTLPTPTAGRQVVVKDSTGSFSTNNLTVDPGAAKIDTVAGPQVVSTNFVSLTYVSNGTDWFLI